MHTDAGFCLTAVEHMAVTLGRNALLTDINFTLHCGQLVAIIGRNGAGKTTMLRALLGEIPYTGKVRFTRHDGTGGRLTLGYVPQRVPLDPTSPTSVFDLCRTSMGVRPAFLPAKRGDRARILTQLDTFGVAELIDRRLCELSGGEWQRVMLAVATTPTPELLILDEPSAGIDMTGLKLFYSKIDELKRTQDMAILMVSHDFDLLETYADHVLLLDHTIKDSGAPADVLKGQAFAALFGGKSAC